MRILLVICGLMALLSACGERGSFADVGVLVDTGVEADDAGVSTVRDTGTSTRADSGR